jgi:thioredoxin reductase
MVANNITKLDGENIKSITLQNAKTTKGVLSTKQIKVKNKYVNIDELSKDDLIEMLEAQGVKTRIVTSETETTKNASIRVQK